MPPPWRGSVITLLNAEVPAVQSPLHTRILFLSAPKSSSAWHCPRCWGWNRGQNKQPLPALLGGHVLVEETDKAEGWGLWPGAARQNCSRAEAGEEFPPSHQCAWEEGHSFLSLLHSWDAESRVWGCRELVITGAHAGPGAPSVAPRHIVMGG